jgi:hypothetical protein
VKAASIPDAVDHHLIEQAQAQAERALVLLDRLEALVTRVGGHTTHADQATIRDARALLEETGTRKSVAPKLYAPKTPEWAKAPAPFRSDVLDKKR